MNSKVYKWCAVPQCNNTSIRTPDKVFVHVPNKKNIRDKWLTLAWRNPNDVVTNSPIYFCEDHFDLPNDMENYMEYHLMGSVSQVRTKPGCMPHKFICQPDRNTQTAGTSEQPYIAKKRRLMSLKECKKDSERKCTVTDKSSFEGIASGSSAHVKEEPEFSLEESCVKLEPSEYDDQMIKTEPSSELYAGHVVKIEPYTEHVETEPLSELYTDHAVKSEPHADHVVETEPSWGLYTGHVVKDELLLGPERPQHPMVDIVVHGAVLGATTGSPQSRERALETPARLVGDGELSDWLALEGAHAAASVKHEPGQRATNTETVIYACDLCGHLFKLKQKLIRHIKDHSKTHARTQSDNSDKPYCCEICKKSFNRLHTLLRHKRIHTIDKKPYSCEICDEKFSTSNKLAEHKWLHTGDKPFSCEICEKKFRSSKYVATHKRIHSSNKPYTCDICEKKFKFSSKLTIHKRIHTGDKPYACKICKKKFTTLGNLTKHERIHSGDKPFACEICEKKFIDSSCLTVHKRIHSGDKPYACTLCEKKFSTSSILKSHIRTHARERPFSCEVCKKTFTQRRGIKRHMCR